MEIKAKWDEIRKGNYEVGDYKELDLGDMGSIRMEIVARNATELADGSGRASYDFVALDALAENMWMSNAATSEGGWEDSGLRWWLNEELFAMMPAELRDSIVEVKKYSMTKVWSDEREWWVPCEQSTADRIWIPSMREVAPEDITQNETPIAKLNAACGRPSPTYEYEADGPTYVEPMLANLRPHGFWLRSADLLWWGYSFCTAGSHPLRDSKGLSTGAHPANCKQPIVVGFSI